MEEMMVTVAVSLHFCCAMAAALFAALAELHDALVESLSSCAIIGELEETKPELMRRCGSSVGAAVAMVCVPRIGGFPKLSEVVCLVAFPS